MPITIKDVAERVGRSITTVSRALNDYDDVSEETRQIVKRVAKEMGYVPNSFAQKLQKRRTDTISIIMPTAGPRFTDPFFGEFLAGIGNTAAQKGFDLLVSTRPPGEKEVEAYLEKIRSRRVDGFVIVRTRRNDPRIALLKEHKFPFASFGRTEGLDDFPFVDEDSQAGMYLVTKHLLERGHTKIACISAPSELMLAHYRMVGFKNALSEYNLPIDEAIIIQGNLTQQSGYEIAGRLLTQTPRPTAIVACNDLMAIGAISAAQERGLVVGQDIAITGFDDTPWAEHTHPPLTTIHQPIYHIGTMVTEMLIKIINGEELEERQIILQPSLIIRQSSG